MIIIIIIIILLLLFSSFSLFSYYYFFKIIIIIEGHIQYTCVIKDENDSHSLQPLRCLLVVCHHKIQFNAVR